MKKKSIYLLILLIAMSNIVFSQTKLIEHLPHSTNIINCNPNTFWLSRIFGPYFETRINEYTLINNTVSPTNPNMVIGPRNYMQDLAYALDSNNNPTFFQATFKDSTNLFDTLQLTKFNGTSWDTIFTFDATMYGRCGVSAGKGHYLVIKDNPFAIDGNPIRLSIFNTQNNMMYPIYTIPTQNKFLSNPSFDSDYNIWFLENDSAVAVSWGIQPSGNVATNLKAIDTLGNLVYHYPIPFFLDLNDIYGSFIMNNKLYVGIGYTNFQYPHSLLPFSILNGVFTMEPPISFYPPPNINDLESCNVGTLVSVNEIPSYLKELSLYPNPANSNFTVYLPYKTSAKAQITVSNSQGQLVYSSAAIDYNTVNCSTWSRGVYLINLHENGKIITSKKIVLE
ncbi:MAG: Secretion system C-terminal sorting domain [Bacteroidota bacterium]|jgi:hypothetical protein